MRSKVRSSIFYLVSAYVFFGLSVFIARHIKVDEKWNLLGILFWLIPFCQILFVLCYKSFYTSIRESLILTVFAYVLSFATVVVTASALDHFYNTPDINTLVTIYLFLFLTLPVPYCYAAWYFDKFFADRTKK